MADQILENRPVVVETPEAKEHNREISENYKRLLDSALPTKEREEAPAHHETSYVPEEPAPVAERPLHVNVDPSAVNAARLADYTAHPAPAQQGKKILFEDVTYKQGCYTTGPRDSAVAEPVYAPVYESVNEPVYEQAYAAPAPVQAEEEMSEDARPTARTMQHLQRSVVEETVATESQAGFFAALSTKTKMLIAAVVTVIVVALMIVCINTAVIGSINADITNKQLELEQLTQRSAQLEQQIENAKNPDAIDEWAQQNGMYR